jgi:hypothetical protein
MVYPRAVPNKRYFHLRPCDTHPFLALGPGSYLVPGPELDFMVGKEEYEPGAWEALSQNIE